MTSTSIYRDIAARTGGDIYIGVVGPVRTGKSTFIKRFFEKMILPNMPEDAMKDRMIDELPQSSAGKTIMTTEPKFVPENAAMIELDDNFSLRVRMIDCVGYIVPSSLGYIENETPRMVKTPWYEEEIPFNMAAELGTKKVITDHSTIGLVVTSDGSISDIPRAEYAEAEERVIRELTEIRKPFVVLLNCVDPEDASSVALAESLSSQYNVPVRPVNCTRLDEDEIREILSDILYEFPVRKIDIACPSWIQRTDDFRTSFSEYIRSVGGDIHCLRQVGSFFNRLSEYENVIGTHSQEINPATGIVSVQLQLSQTLFYAVMSEASGVSVQSDEELMQTLLGMAQMKKKYEKFENALRDVEASGYGIVMPTVDELSLEEPEIMKQGGRYGVRLKASAPSIHMLRADIKTEVAPIVGSEKQSEDLIRYLLKEFEEDPAKIWDSNIFGTSLHELVNEGLRNKLLHMPQEARMKLQQTLQRIINEGCSGLICIII